MKPVFNFILLALVTLGGFGSTSLANPDDAYFVVSKIPLELDAISSGSVCGSPFSEPSSRRCIGTNDGEIGLNDTVSHLKRFILSTSVTGRLLCGVDERGVRCWNGDGRFEKPTQEILAEADDTRIRFSEERICLPRPDKTIRCYNMEKRVWVSAENGAGHFTRELHPTETYGPYQDLRDFAVSDNVLCTIDGDVAKCEPLQNLEVGQIPALKDFTGTFVGAKSLSLSWSSVCVLHDGGFDCHQNAGNGLIKYHADGKWKQAVKLFKMGFETVCGITADNEPVCAELAGDSDVVIDRPLPEIAKPGLKVLKFRASGDTKCALVTDAANHQTFMCGAFVPMTKVDMDDVVDFEVSPWAVCAINSKGRVNCFYNDVQLGSPLPEDGSPIHAAGQCRWNDSRFHCAMINQRIDDTDIRSVIAASTSSVNLPQPCIIYENSQGVRGVKCIASAGHLEKDMPPIDPASSKIVATNDYVCVYGGTEPTCWGEALGGVEPPNLSSVKKILFGYNFGCGTDAYGFFCWGATLDARGLTPPASLGDIDSVRDFAVGANHVCVISREKKVICWGENDLGQTNVPPLTNPVSLIATGNTTCASSDEGVTCWGYREDSLRAAGEKSNLIPGRRP